jgi:ribose transport system substrate-binding protein
MSKRTIVYLLLISIFVLSLPACGTATPTQALAATLPPTAVLPTAVPPTAAPPTAVPPTTIPPVHIAVFFPVLGNSYTKAFTDGIADAAQKMGATADNFGADPAYDAIAQSHQIQDAITSKKYDVFIIYACDGNAVVPDVEDALAAGIKVVAADVVIGPNTTSFAPYPGVVSYIGRTGISNGTMLGQMIVSACATVTSATCKVGYLIGAQALTIDQDRITAINSVLASHTNIKIVASQEAFYLQDKGYEVAQNMLQAHPDINVFATSGDQMMLGAQQAVKDAGLTGKVLLIGNGTSKEGYAEIKAGTWFADYADIPYTEGQISGQVAINAVRGIPVLTSVNNDDQRPPLPPDGPIITKENVDQFTPQW